MSVASTTLRDRGWSSWSNLLTHEARPSPTSEPPGPPEPGPPSPPPCQLLPQLPPASPTLAYVSSLPLLTWLPPFSEAFRGDLQTALTLKHRCRSATHDGTSNHPDVIWHSDSHTFRHDHGCGTAPDSHRLPHITQASTQPLGRQRTLYTCPTGNGYPHPVTSPPGYVKLLTQAADH